MNSIYIISGPLGVGKTSVSKAIAAKLKNAVTVEGDIFFLSLENIDGLSWEDRLSLCWKNVLCITKNYLEKNINVVVDFVVEDELEWFCKNCAGLEVEIKYVVLIAEEKVLEKQLTSRGDQKYLTRSLALLKKLQADPKNTKHLYKTASTSIDQVAIDIIANKNFIV